MFLIAMIYHMQDFLASLMFMISFQKKPHYKLRLCGALLAGIIPIFLFNDLLGQSSPLLFLRYLLYFSLIVLVMWFSYDVSPMQAFVSASSGKAVQHLVHNLVIMTEAVSPHLSPNTHALSSALLSCVYFVPVCLLVWFLLARRIESYPDESQYKSMSALSTLILFICIGISRFAKDFQTGDNAAALAESLYAITCCVLCLILQYVLRVKTRLVRDNSIIRHLWQEDKKQLAEKKENIELMNIKYHDIKQRLQDYDGILDHGEIETLRHLTNLYETALDTSNQTLNVILADKALYCDAHHIKLTFMGDGSCLSRLNESEVHSLFGNALSNAIRACEALPEAERVISILVKSAGGLISINIRNYYSGELILHDGLPQTTKDDEEGFHGYGIRSMQLICQRYGGDLRITADHHVFDLQMWFLA